MTQFSIPYTSNLGTNNHDDYGQFWDTETQKPIYDQQTHDLLDNNEYDYYLNNYESTLTQQEQKLDLEYGRHDYGLNSVSTIGFVIFIIKTISKYIYR